MKIVEVFQCNHRREREPHQANTVDQLTSRSPEVVRFEIDASRFLFSCISYWGLLHLGCMGRTMELHIQSCASPKTTPLSASILSHHQCLPWRQGEYELRRVSIQNLWRQSRMVEEYGFPTASPLEVSDSSPAPFS